MTFAGISNGLKNWFDRDFWALSFLLDILVFFLTWQHFWPLFYSSKGFVLLSIAFGKIGMGKLTNVGQQD
jgi:hypothetical protein